MLLSNVRNASGFQEYFKGNPETPTTEVNGNQGDEEQALETKTPKSTPESRAQDLEEIMKREYNLRN